MLRTFAYIRYKKNVSQSPSCLFKMITSNKNKIHFELKFLANTLTKEHKSKDQLRL